MLQKFGCRLAAFIIAFAVTVAEARNIDWYLDKEVPVGFGYDRTRWTPVAAADSTSRFVVNWTTKSGGLVASCYLQMARNPTLDHLNSNIHAAHKKFRKTSLRT